MNPFNCNCHLAWFAEWLKKHGLIAGSPRCAGPARVMDVPIHDLPSYEFKCSGKLNYAVSRKARSPTTSVAFCLREIARAYRVKGAGNENPYAYRLLISQSGACRQYVRGGLTVKPFSWNYLEVDTRCCRERAPREMKN